MNVVFVIYRRPELTARVFEAIARAKPERLFVIADGPKNAEEEDLCAAARAVAERVDWPCEVRRNYSKVNLGCGRRVSSGLDWVFSQVEDAIILEDDCVPHPDFFPFCSELLERYRDDQRISHITGLNAESLHERTTFSYFFSRYSPSWGWATWRRAWQHFDFDMKLWPVLRDGGWHKDMFRSATESDYFAWWWDLIREGRDDTWDAQWLFARLVQGTYGIVSSVNLISNIGFGPGARGCSDARHPLASVPTRVVEFPLRHPSWFICDTVADTKFAEQCNFRIPEEPYCPLTRRIWGRVRNPHWYGMLLRRVPVIRGVWARWRGSRNKVAGDGA